MRFYSRVFLVFLMKECKKRRRKQPSTLMAKSRSQPVNLPGARPLMNPLLKVFSLKRSPKGAFGEPFRVLCRKSKL